MVRQIIRLSDYWSKFGLLVFPDNWFLGPVVYRNIGMSPIRTFQTGSLLNQPSLNGDVKDNKTL